MGRGRYLVNTERLSIFSLEEMEHWMFGCSIAQGPPKYNPGLFLRIEFWKRRLEIKLCLINLLSRGRR
jgi:hypothetical protein